MSIKPSLTDHVRSLPTWLLILLCFIYVVCPLDFDFVPVIGWLDDFAVLAFTALETVRRIVTSPKKVDGMADTGASRKAVDVSST